MRRKGFTLVELILVVSILGILAALVVPAYQGQASEAKMSAAKSNLHALRGQIELYKMHHNATAPGYVDGAAATIDTMQLQLTGTTTPGGQTSANKVPTAPFVLGPYMKKTPVNPFNTFNTFSYVDEASAFAAAVDGKSGWLYKKETGEVRLNFVGTDKEGVAYVTY